MIIGLTGKFAAGKGAAAEFFQRHGFSYLSLSDILREELAARGQATSRENLIAAGQALRREAGPAVLARRAMARLAGRTGDVVVDSIRSPAEVAALRELPGFTLLGIDAPAPLRFARLRARGRLGDSASLEEFIRQEAAEDGADPNGQQLTATLALADAVLENASDLNQLTARLEQFLATRRPPAARP
jgi:dephospho-CoA kinase